MSTYLVLGVGMQGTAAAYDLIQSCGATRLILADSSAERLEAAEQRLVRMTGFPGIEVRRIDVAGPDGPLRAAFEEAEACMNCLPYRFSLAITRLALDTGTHLADLGGNTAVVREQLAMAAAHPRGSDVAVLPDCGLMPGMGNLFVAHAVAELGDCAEVRVRCGGLPTEPEGPLQYALLFNVHGLINEYFGRAQVLRGGAVTELDTFTELEPLAVDFAARGLEQRDCEAFITSGGLSTTPWTFAGRIGELDYKTIRYAGHHERFGLLVELGLLAEDELQVTPSRAGAQGPVAVAPRDVLATCLERALSYPGTVDLAVLRCTATATDGRTLELEMFDVLDDVTGFTAMERATAFSATACLYGALKGKVAIGGGPIEAAVDTTWYLGALAERGIEVTLTKG
ncbi:MAG: saccharopine dehydrogenase C-terminal domain-containing protein [Planctomycetota bacterium]|nr:saccharopine dehydrogenase C-terminal domain-containing protein [Planctomycetota bacterium]